MQPVIAAFDHRKPDWLQTEFETSPGSIAVPLLKGPKSRSVTVSLPGRFRQSRPTVSHQYTVASGAYCNFLPVSGEAHGVLVALDSATIAGFCGSLNIHCRVSVASNAPPGCILVGKES